MSCKGCKHDLGGGCCRINCEAECREGGGFELYEPVTGGVPDGGREVDQDHDGHLR